MISHVYKCIFVHISRTAGTSIENAICGHDWWQLDPLTKHLTASQSSKIYREHWDNYFKFAFVRNPLDRLLSCYHMDYFNGHPMRDVPSPYTCYYKTIIRNGIKYYMPPNIGIESGANLSSFMSNYIPPPWEPSQTEYTDILDRQLDFIGKYENLQADFDYVKRRIGLKKDLPHVNKQIRSDHCVYDEFAIVKAKDMYKHSLIRFNYTIA